MADNLANNLAGFVTDHGDSLVALAFTLTGSREEAEDIVQNVLARLLQADLTSIDNLLAYARRAVCNETNTWGRSVARQGRRSRVLQSEWSRTLRTQSDPYGRVELLSALAALNSRQRTAVVLRYFLHLDDNEIGAMLGCSTGTVRSLLSRGPACRCLSNEMWGLTCRNAANVDGRE